MQVTRAAVPAADFSLKQTEERLKQVREMRKRTLASLLQCFSAEDGVLSNTSLPQDYQSRAGFPDRARDTAIVLTAIENFGKDLMAPRERDEYREHIFDRALKAMVTGSEKVLGKRWRREGNEPPPAPFTKRDPFTCSVILTLLNWYSSENTHQDVYVDAVDFVLEALCMSYAPHYTFGGASLTDADPHGFVSFYCIDSLKGVVQTLRDRAREHVELASLLRELKNRQEEQYSVARLKFSEWQAFSHYLNERLTTLEKRQPVGLGAVVPEIRNVLNSWPDTGPDTSDLDMLATTIGPKLKNEVSQWLDQFRKLVETKISATQRELDAELQAARGQELDNDDGTNRIRTEKHYSNCSGLSYKSAFQVGMTYVLGKMRDIYQKLPADSSRLGDLMEVIGKVGQEWQESADRTDRYVKTFGKWATAELHRQISLYPLDSCTNFDAAQLAFVLRIHHLLAAEPNPEVARQGLEMLLECQLRDGTWPTGSPLAFETNTQLAVHVANIEIINAVMPLMEEYGGVQRYHQNLNRVFNWLETNRRDISLPGLGNRQNKRITITGWPTDKISHSGRVDLWMGARALEFLHGYEGLLQESINDRSLESYNVKQACDIKISWEDLIDPELCEPYHKRTTTRIYKGYVREFKESLSSPRNAMVLYGPPGTSKTTLAQCIAKELDWRLVTITPSDFVKTGIENSERMARELFENLLRVRKAVVLFDEIDEMLRSRSEKSNAQSGSGSGVDPGAAQRSVETAAGGIGILRFLIPGMLPKLQDLKQYGEKHALIFIIATNYKERLDKAIARPGRIDDLFLVTPPDSQARQLLVRKFLKDEEEKLEKETQKKQQILPTAPDQLEALLCTLADFTSGGWIYTEIKMLVEALLAEPKENHNMTADKVGARPSPSLLVAIGGGAQDAHQRLSELAQQTRLDKRSFDLEDFYASRPDAADEKERVRLCCVRPALRQAA